MVQHRRPHQPQTYGTSCTTFACADLTAGAGVTASVAAAASAVAVNTAAAPVMMILRMTSSFFGHVARGLRFVTWLQSQAPKPPTGQGDSFHRKPALGREHPRYQVVMNDPAIICTL